MSLIRAFIAIELPPELKKELTKVETQLLAKHKLDRCLHIWKQSGHAPRLPP